MSAIPFNTDINLNGQAARKVSFISGSGGLTLTSDESATKGKIYFGSAQTSVFDEVNGRLGIGTNAPSYPLHVNGFAMLGAIVYINGTDVYINKYTTGVLALGATDSVRMSNVFVGSHTSAPTAKLHIIGGSASANTAPLKFTSGTLLTTPETGAVEFNASHFYGTVGTTRYQLDQPNAQGAETASISTTDGTQTTLQTIAIPSTKTVKIDATVIARCTGGSSGTVGNAAAYKISAAYKNVSGTVTIIGSGSTPNNEMFEDVPAWDATFVISGTNVLVRVTGAAATSITWQLAEIKVYSI